MQQGCKWKWLQTEWEGNLRGNQGDAENSQEKKYR